MSRKKRKVSTRLIKKNISYSILEICELLDVHKNTVFNWFGQGLKKIDSVKPYLVHGENLKEFLDVKYQSRKRTTKINELYCMRCQKPRTALGNMADLEIDLSNRLTLQALCSSCESPMFKLQSSKQLAILVKSFDIPQQQLERLIALTNSNYNCDLSEDKKA